MNKLSSILGAAAVMAIAIVFIVQFRPASQATGASGKTTCAVEVRGSCISSTHFWAAYRLVAPRNADATRLRSMGLRRLTAEGLLERWLLVQEAKRLGITVSDDDVSAELAAGRARVSLPVDKSRQLAMSLGMHEDLVRFIPVKSAKTKRFDVKTYEREVRMLTNLSPADFRDFQRDELIAARMRDLVRSRVRVGDTEVFDQFSAEKSTATIDYVRFDRGFYADVALDRSPAAVEAWAASNKEELDRTWDSRKKQILPECRVVRQVFAAIDPEAVDPDAEKAKARSKIEGAIQRIGNGESFAAVARQVSDDPSAARGGEIGCLARGTMPKPFEDAALALEQGKLSGVIETEIGMFALEVEQIAKDAEAETLGRQQTATALYLAHESERLAAEAAKQVLAAVRGGKSLADAVTAHLAELPRGKAAAGEKKKGDKDKKDKKDAAPAAPTAETHAGRPAVETSLPFSASGEPIPGVRAGGDVATMAFGLAKPGDVPNDIVPLETGYAVFALREKTPVSQEQWDKDRDFYVAAMRAAKQNDALAAYMRDLRSKLATEVKYDQSLVTEPKGRPEDGDEPFPDPLSE